MTQPTPLERYTTAVALALTLPAPRLIARAILASTPDVDDGLRAANYDGDKVTGGVSSSPVERMVAQRNPGQFPKDDDGKEELVPGSWERGARHNLRPTDELLRLSKASERAVEAVANLLAEALDAGCPDLDDYSWDDAVKDAHLIAEHKGGETLRAAVDLGRDVTKWADRFSHAIDTVRAIRDSWMAHAPAQGLAEANFAWCRSHLRIGAQVERATRVLCRWCYRQVEDLELGGLGDAVELQLEQRSWPSEDMLRSNAEGRRAAVARDRRDWLLGHGLDPAVVDRRRALKRAG